MKNSTLLLVDRHIQINHCPNLLVSKQIPDFNKVKPWIPSLLVGKPGNSTVKAVQASALISHSLILFPLQGLRIYFADTGEERKIVFAKKNSKGD